MSTLRTFLLALLPAGVCAQTTSDAALTTLLDEIGKRYQVAQEATPQERLDELARRIGEKMSTAGAGVEAKDIAVLALLLASRTGAATPSPPRPVPAQPQPVTPTAAPPPPSSPTVQSSDLSKGLEGFLQGIERLQDLPASQRFVFTGDISSGLQAATVSSAPDLTSMFGRARVNVVARATPASPNGVLGSGYFFLQLQAAGGPATSEPVGGPRSFSAFNDVATRSSRFNEGLSRGNIYLGKAYFQQELQLGENRAIGRVGVIDLADFFDTNLFANNESRQFLNSAFVNSPGYKTGFSAPGFMGEYYRKTDRDWLTGVVLRAGYAVSRTDRAFTSPIWNTEIEANTLYRGLRGNWRAGFTTGHVAGVGGLHGYHLSGDHWISQRVGVFGRYAFSNAGAGSLSLSPVRQSYGGGVQWRFVRQNDRTSAYAIAFSQAFPIDRTLSSERVFETYYRWQVTRNFSLSPDLQFILGSGGRTQKGTQLVLGVRMFFGL